MEEPFLSYLDKSGKRVKFTLLPRNNKFHRTRFVTPNEQAILESMWRCDFCTSWTSIEYKNCYACMNEGVPSYWYCDTCEIIYDSHSRARLLRCQCKAWCTELVITGQVVHPNVLMKQETKTCPSISTQGGSDLSDLQTEIDKIEETYKDQNKQQKGTKTNLLASIFTPWLEKDLDDTLSWVCDSPGPCTQFHSRTRLWKKNECLCGKGVRPVSFYPSQVNLGYRLDPLSEEYWEKRKSINLKREFLSWVKTWHEKGFENVLELRVAQEAWKPIPLTFQEENEEENDERVMVYTLDQIAQYATRLLDQDLLDCVTWWSLIRKKDETWKKMIENQRRNKQPAHQDEDDWGDVEWTQQDTNFSFEDTEEKNLMDPKDIYEYEMCTQYLYYMNRIDKEDLMIFKILVTFYYESTMIGDLILEIISFLFPGVYLHCTLKWFFKIR